MAEYANQLKMLRNTGLAAAGVASVVAGAAAINAATASGETLHSAGGCVNVVSPHATDGPGVYRPNCQGW